MEPKISQLMTGNPVGLPATATIAEAARKMADHDIGDVLVLQDDTLKGMVTDRDIVVRALAQGLDPRLATIGQICSPNPICLEPDDAVSHAVEVMRDNALRRLPVCEGERLVGIVTIGDLAMSQDSHSALAGISAAPPNQ